MRANRILSGACLRVLGVLGLVVFSAVAGYYIGVWSVPRAPLPMARMPHNEAPATQPEPEPPERRPPLFLYAAPPAGSDFTATTAEIRMAGEAGIHQHIVGVTMPWEGDPPDLDERLDAVLEADPAAQVLLVLDLNPPLSWLEQNPDDRTQVGDALEPYGCIASQAWRQAAENALATVTAALAKHAGAERVAGFVVGCLEQGQWCRTGGYDVCPANQAGFRRWLGGHYADDAALREAWRDKEVTLEAAEIPTQPAGDDRGQVFYDPSKTQKNIDFLRYTSDTTADAVLAVTQYVKQSSDAARVVLVPYGYSYELPGNNAGHFVLERLIESEVDGFIGPVSYADRGIGGPGGPPAPVDSVLAHGKQWYFIDDTRTGVSRDPATGEVQRIKGLQIEDVLHVQLRNFAAALVHGTALCWADPLGEGWLYDPTAWQRFASLQDIYSRSLNDASASDGQGMAMPGWPSGPSAATLAVVADEASRFIQRCDAPLNSLLLVQARDAAMRVGLGTRFYLLHDVLEAVVDPCRVYLFLNAFRLTENERTRLHAILERQQAAAIWLYAPGYCDGASVSVESIAATVGMGVKAFDKSAAAGSKWTLSGGWMTSGDEFGAAGEWQPLFYVEDDKADVIAKYKASEKPSAAIRFLEAGWTSVYLADPGVSTHMLRALLALLEVPLYVRETPEKFEDTVHTGRGFLAVHAGKAGERTFDLGARCSVQDLLDPDVGWSHKQAFNVTLKAGQTRLFAVTPEESEDAQGNPDPALEQRADEPGQEPE